MKNLIHWPLKQINLKDLCSKETKVFFLYNFIIIISLITLLPSLRNLLNPTSINKLSRAQITLVKVNKYFESIEDNMFNLEYKKVCNEVNKAKKIIDSNINLLSFIEPYYNWDEMIDLLDELEERSCRLPQDNSYDLKL